MKVLFEFNNGRRKRVNERDAKALTLLRKGQIVGETNEAPAPQYGETTSQDDETTPQDDETGKQQTEPTKKAKTRPKKTSKYKRRDMSAE